MREWLHSWMPSQMLVFAVLTDRPGGARGRGMVGRALDLAGVKREAALPCGDAGAHQGVS